MGLAGVGQRLMDHPSISLSSFVRRGARMNEHTRRHHAAWPALFVRAALMCRRATCSSSCSPNRLARGRRADRLGADLLKQDLFGDRTVKLASRDPAEPIVEFNLLPDRRDLDRLMSGFRKMAAMQMSESVKAVTDKPFPGGLTDRVRRSTWSNTKTEFSRTSPAA